MSLSDVARHSSTTIVKETYDEVGYNFRMTDMQAALGLAQLRRLPELLERRRFLAHRYSVALQDIPWIILPTAPLRCRPNYQSYMIRLIPDAIGMRDSTMQRLLEWNIATRRGIMAIHREPPYYWPGSDTDLPCTALATDTGIIVPLFHQMTETEQDYIVEAVHRILAEGW
jgi:dTDP-4-amino-4,6-dideoxygalactose transaminase